MNDTSFYCHDPLRPYEPKQTESAGTLTPNATGTFYVSDPTVAQELKAKYPQMLVGEGERQMMQGTKVRGRTSFVMPAVPWETEWERKRKAKAATNESKTP